MSNLPEPQKPKRRWVPRAERDTVEPSETCNAKLRNGSGDLCKRQAGWGTSHLGSGRCRTHGGADGIGRPIKHGRYSKYAPKNIARRIEELAEDDSIMDLTAEVALVTAMIEAELAGVREAVGEQADAWDRARQLYDVALANASTAEGLRAMNTLGLLLRGGTDVVTRWRRIDEMLARKTNLVQVHGRRLRDENMTLSVREVHIFTMRVASVLGEELVGVVPTETLIRIGQRIEAFM